MKILSPYRNCSQWFRGNTHTHSTLSDGEWPLEKVIGYYRDRGYAFLAMTDHDIFTDLSGFATPDFVGISSNEVTVRGRDHIVGLHLTGPMAVHTNHHQRIVDEIVAQGGLAILAHPNWSWMLEDKGLALHGVHALEIFNVVCNYLEYDGYALQWWDYLLRRGLRIWGIAADDAHRIPYHGARGWIMVNAESLSAETIAQNIRDGNFYASTGPTFQRFEVVRGAIQVWCSPAVEIRFLTGGVGNPALRVKGDALTHAEYTPRAGEAYVRVEVVDAQMETAWSQPFFLEPDWRP